MTRISPGVHRHYPGRHRRGGRGGPVHRVRRLQLQGRHLASTTDPPGGRRGRRRADGPASPSSPTLRASWHASPSGVVSCSPPAGSSSTPATTPIALTDALPGTRTAVVVRIRSDRVFYPDPPAPAPGSRGRPRRHGDRRSCADPASWPDPDQRLSATDSRYGTVTVAAWHRLHPRLAAAAAGAPTTPHRSCPAQWSASKSSTCPNRPPGRSRRCGRGAPDRPRSTWTSPGAPTCGASTSNTPSVSSRTPWAGPHRRCAPRTGRRWTWLIVAAYTQLRPARGIVADIRLPWQRPREPGKLTPARVRRGLPRLRATIGKPANPPKSSTAGRSSTPMLVRAVR